MSAGANEERATPARGPGPAAGERGPARFMSGMSTEKALDFKGSGKRLLAMLRPYRLLTILALTLAVGSVTLSVLAPRLLGEAINLVFDGYESHRGVDFGHVGQIVGVVAALNVGASVCALFQGRLTATMVQRAVFRLREQVQAKLSRLPLSYFDRQSRGEILSRVTNDIDNLQQSVQQTLSQLVTSLLTIVGVLALMFIVSWQLALIALVTVPASAVAMRKLAKRAQPQFINQWKFTGRLNGHIEEMYTGHALVTAFGQREEAMATFDRAERGALPGQLPGAVHLRHDPAADDVHVEPELRAGGRRRRPADRERLAHPRRGDRLHPVLAAVQPAADPGRQHGEPAAVERGIRRARVRAA